MILRFCVVIPTCDHGRTISEVVKDAVLNTVFPILVVDDGSVTHAHDSLYSWEVRRALEAGRVKVLRLEKKSGKGAALRRAIADLVKSGFTHMLTMDPKGTFKASEAAKLVELSRKHPWDMIIGDRNLKSEVTETNVLRRKLSNLLVTYQTGSHIKDAQSAFRIYPLLPLQSMSFWTSGEDFDNEVLIRLLWQGTHVHETEVAINKCPKEEDARGLLGKIAHSIRLSLLNTFLVFVSLFKTHRSASEVAWALGLGVFIGCTPFFGFHTLIIAAVAIVFRLNLVVMWLGSHVSTPIIAIFIYASEIWIGKHWLHIGMEPGGGGLKGDFYQALGGSMVLGSGLGLATVILVYASSWIMRRRKRYSNWSAKRRGGKFGRALLRFALKRLGQVGAYRLLRLTRPYFYLFAPKARRGLNEYWKLREPALGWWPRQKKIYHHLRIFGEILIDRGLRSAHPEYNFEILASNLDEVNQAIAARHGAILLSAHMGAWDLAAEMALRESGPIRLVSLRREGYRFYTFQESMDPTKNVELRGPLASADSEIREALARGESMAIMGDRPLGDHYQLIPFLGKLAPFDMTVFRLAAEANVPVFFNFGFRESPGKFQFFVGSGKIYKFDPTLPREIQCYRWAREYVQQIEKFARRFPYEWFNLYPFWSAPPTVLSGELAAQNGCRLIEDFGEAARHMPN